jgi:hypothetical protein
MTMHYAFDEQTGEYIGPVASALANTLPVPPPSVEAGKAICVYGAGWQLVDDHRGKTAYRENGEAVQVWWLGPLPSDVTLSPPQQVYSAAVQAHIDATARGRGYDSGVSLASYVASTITSWAAEAAAFVAWRDAVWAYAYMELAKVRNAERSQPTVAELVAELPTITWP